MTDEPDSRNRINVRYEQCVIDAKGNCTRWSHDHGPRFECWGCGSRYSTAEEAANCAKVDLL